MRRLGGGEVGRQRAGHIGRRGLLGVGQVRGVGLEGALPPGGRTLRPALLRQTLPRLAHHLAAHGVGKAGVDQCNVFGVTGADRLQLLGRARLQLTDPALVAGL